MPSAEANEMVQRFGLHFPDITFAERICLGRLHGNSNTSYVRFPKRVELVWELSVSVPDNESRFNAFVLHPHRGVTRLLHYPLRIGMIGAWTMEHFPAAEMDKDEHMGITNSTQRKNTLRKEIARHNCVQVGVNKGCPGDRRVFRCLVRLREMPFFLEDASNRRGADADTEPLGSVWRLARLSLRTGKGL